MLMGHRLLNWTFHLILQLLSCPAAPTVKSTCFPDIIFTGPGLLVVQLNTGRLFGMIMLCVLQIFSAVWVLNCAVAYALSRRVGAFFL